MMSGEQEPFEIAAVIDTVHPLPPTGGEDVEDPLAHDPHRVSGDEERAVAVQLQWDDERLRHRG